VNADLCVATLAKSEVMPSFSSFMSLPSFAALPLSPKFALIREIRVKKTFVFDPFSHFFEVKLTVITTTST